MKIKESPTKPHPSSPTPGRGSHALLRGLLTSLFQINLFLLSLRYKGAFRWRPIIGISRKLIKFPEEAF
ncbi:hypothetical protein TDIS_0422 [Thermosulfurimonas dismutans]|uniref:Uncharacterized protein n=1 Tax=Thermosulfurimonas dismutans TaxID=999894 RepID=A0A179D6Y0_9BACT|nr:hypothetical protein TDIS_0422 [Thermosulfurimonas dismutans]